jgi:hypothetical protein
MRMRNPYRIGQWRSRNPATTEPRTRAFRYALILVLFSMLGCDTSNNVDPVYKKYFIKTFGGDGNQQGVDMVINTDNTITILGNSIHPTGEQKVYFIVVDVTGKIVVQKEIGGDNEIAKDIEPVPGGYIILSNLVVSPERYDIKLTYVNPLGEVISSVVFDGYADQFGNSVTAVSDGRYFVIGNTRDTDADLNSKLVDITDVEDILIIEFNNLFEVLNTFRIGSSSIGMGIKIFENANNTFTYAGYSDEIREGEEYNSNFIFRTFTSEPASVATLFVGDNVSHEKMAAFVKTGNGNFYAVGTELGTGGASRIFIAHVRNGISVPVKLYSTTVTNGKLEGVSASLSSNGGALLVAANEYSITDNTSDIRIYNVDPFTGSERWSKSFGSSEYSEKANAVGVLPDGSILIVGTVNLINQDKIALIKVNSEGSF